MSQPELDTSGTFDIPSPPPLSSNRSEAYFSFPVGSFLTPRTGSEPKELCSAGGAEGTPRASAQKLHLEDLPTPAARTQADPGRRTEQAEPALNLDLQNRSSSAAPHDQPDDAWGDTEPTLKNGNASDAPLGQNLAPTHTDHVTSDPRTVVLTEEQRTGPSREDSAAPLGNGSAQGEPARPAEGSDSVAIDPDPTRPPISQDSFISEVIASLLQNPEVPPASQTSRTPPLPSHDPSAGFSGSGEIKSACSASAQIQVPAASRSHSGGLVPDPAASPVSDYRVSCSKRPLVLIRRTFADVPGMNVQDDSGGSDRALSPAYLSLGSDEGSAVEVYFSAPEENMESGEEEEEEEMFTVEETPEGQRSEELQGKSELILGSDPAVEGKAERVEAGEELLAPPVPQVNRPMECDSGPPSSDPPGEVNQAGDVEAEDLPNEEQKARSLQGKVLLPDTGRAEETGEELSVCEGEAEERTSGWHTCAAAGGTPDAAEGAETLSQSAETQRQVSDELLAPDAPDLHPAQSAGHLEHR